MGEKMNARKSTKNAAKSTGNAKVGKLTPEDKKTIEDLVAANRILYAQSVLDGYGHVSARHDSNSDRFWLSRGMALGLATPGAIMGLALRGEPIDGRGRP